MSDIKKTPPPLGPRKAAPGPREKKVFSRNQTFGIDLKDDVEITGFAAPTKYTPALDPSYIFPKDETRVLLLSIVNRDRTLIVGHTGCLAGDTSIRYRRSGHLGPRTRSLESLYKKINNLDGRSRPWNMGQDTFIQSVDCDGVAYYNKVLSVIYSGKKECVELTTTDGSSIVCTPDHPIMTEDGNFIQAGSLQAGSRLLMCRSWKSEEGQGKKIRQPRVSVTVKYHPHGTLRLRWGKYAYKEVRRSLLVIEANMNGLLLKDFIHILRNDLETASKFRYLPEGVEIHHIDEVSTNDVISNLLVVTKAEHAKLHAKVENFRRECMHVECVKTVKSSAVQDTYDIQMQHPDHNFSASNFVVHNTGKTSIIEQVAARINYSVFKISFDACLTRNDLVGEWVVKKGDMTYQRGILPVAMSTPGTIIILDEWDTINADTSFVIQRLLQREDGKLLLLEKGADEDGDIEVVELHPDNVIIATANTCGQGDDTGLYAHGTRVQNYAQLNRFGITIRMSWLKPEDEENMLMKKFSKYQPEALKQHEATAFVKCVNKVRDGFANHQLSVPLSTRDLINWVEKYLLIGNPHVAAKYCFINRMSIEDGEVCKSIVQRAFDDA